MEELDGKHKLSPTKELYEAIQQVTNVSKLLDAKEAAKDIVYVRKHMFEYQGKPKKQLARILAETMENNGSALRNEKGEMVIDLEQQIDLLGIF